MLVQDEIRQHGLTAFCEPRFIRITRHSEFNNLVMLKYDQINSPMDDVLVQKCRGLILDESDDWKIISYPFDRFFNHGEPNAAAIDWSTATVYEKLDGSLMSLYWYAGEWRVASSGTPDAGGSAHESGITFKELFWKTWNSLGYRLPDPQIDLDWNETTFMFELMTPENRVVVPHVKSRLVLIGVRPMLESDFVESPVNAWANFCGWETVQSYPLTSLVDVVAASEKLRGLDGEGFVVRDAQFNRIKVKCPQYVALSHMKESLNPKSMLEVIRKGESDEFLTYFPELKPVYDGVRVKFEELCSSLESEYEGVRAIPVQKDFALAVKGSKCSAALFSVRNGKAKTIREHFAQATALSVERALGLSGW